MKKFLLFSALLASLLAVSSCDFFRHLAGRPTSADIEAKREYILRTEMEHQARIDSLARVQKQLSDSLALLDSVRKSSSNMITTSKLGNLGGQKLPYRYYIVVGAFSNKDNASRLASKLDAEGFSPTVVPYRNGFTAVAICPSNTLSEVYASLKSVKDRKFCPADAWVLVNE